VKISFLSGALLANKQAKKSAGVAALKRTWRAIGLLRIGMAEPVGVLIVAFFFPSSISVRAVATAAAVMGLRVFSPDH
jgi:hypothetical protein